MFFKKLLVLISYFYSLFFGVSELLFFPYVGTNDQVAFFLDHANFLNLGHRKPPPTPSGTFPFSGSFLLTCERADCLSLFRPPTRRRFLSLSWRYFECLFFSFPLDRFCFGLRGVQHPWQCPDSPNETTPFFKNEPFEPPFLFVRRSFPDGRPGGVSFFSLCR